MIKRNKPILKHLPESFNCYDREETLDLSVVFCENIKLVGAEVIILEDESSFQSFISTNFPYAIDFSDLETWSKYLLTDSIEKFEKLDTVILKSSLGIAEDGAVWLDETNFPNDLCHSLPEI